MLETQKSSTGRDLSDASGIESPLPSGFVSSSAKDPQYYIRRLISSQITLDELKELDFCLSSEEVSWTQEFLSLKESPSSAAKAQAASAAPPPNPSPPPPPMSPALAKADGSTSPPPPPPPTPPPPPMFGKKGDIQPPPPPPLPQHSIIKNSATQFVAPIALDLKPR
ncbi:unnamed protein product [Ambrosiozyma monospora]|uniref:Unnamed protein product n=1 Tax=Ambrosiozyma monospora TaxID=43982 RepID=A0ACB5SW28_AMBMO|nr:unnamed protein product [Ambrosiozyma monospora]